MVMTKEDVKTLTLGEIRFTADLSCRPLNLAAVESYINAWHAGERGVPPLVIESKTFEIVAGRHRFKMYERVYGANWRSAEVPVVLDSKAPNPDGHPEQFRAYALNLNRDHGVPITHADRKKVLKDLLDAGEKEERVKMWARRLRESVANVAIYIDDWHRDQDMKAARDTAAQSQIATDSVPASAPVEIAGRVESGPETRAPSGIRADDARSRPRMVGYHLDRMIESLAEVRGLTDMEEQKGIVLVKALIKKSDAIARTIGTLCR